MPLPHRLLLASIVFVTAVAGATEARASDPVPGPLAPQAGSVRAVGAQPAPRASAVAVQGGWWSVEAEWRSRAGVYVAAGVPWGIVPVSLMSGATWIVPLGARVGYQHPLSQRWSLRGSLHGAVVFDDETSKCGCESPAMLTRSFGFAELGARYQSPGGFVAGVDLPLFGIHFPRKPFPPPVSLAFGQAYVGFSWGL
ncbi:MAG TPA: hypothetical protein VHU40_01230 [Polyangia bacterium]|jgi:hypothetical protein|nr:hypothetical protein [Polyangia bacterium]